MPLLADTHVVNYHEAIQKRTRMRVGHRRRRHDIHRHSLLHSVSLMPSSSGPDTSGFECSVSRYSCLVEEVFVFDVSHRLVQVSLDDRYDLNVTKPLCGLFIYVMACFERHD